MIKETNGFTNHPLDENNITNLLNLEEKNQKENQDENIIEKILNYYSVS